VESYALLCSKRAPPPASVLVHLDKGNGHTIATTQFQNSIGIILETRKAMHLDATIIKSSYSGCGKLCTPLFKAPPLQQQCWCTLLKDKATETKPLTSKILSAPILSLEKNYIQIQKVESAYEQPVESYALLCSRQTPLQQLWWCCLLKDKATEKKPLTSKMQSAPILSP